MKTEILKKLLIKLVEKVNADLGCQKLKFNQQNIIKGNMSFSGGNGRLCINPSTVGYDVSISGLSSERQLSPELEKLFGRKADGFKQTNKNTGKITQAFWRTDDFELVRRSAIIYSKTDSSK